MSVCAVSYRNARGHLVRCRNRAIDKDSSGWDLCRRHRDEDVARILANAVPLVWALKRSSLLPAAPPEAKDGAA